MVEVVPHEGLSFCCTKPGGSGASGFAPRRVAVTAEIAGAVGVSAGRLETTIDPVESWDFDDAEVWLRSFASRAAK